MSVKYKLLIIIGAILTVGALSFIIYILHTGLLISLYMYIKVPFCKLNLNVNLKNYIISIWMILCQWM